MTVSTPIGNFRTITAEDQFTEGIFIKNRGWVSITGAGTMTLTLQYRLQDETTWNDADDETINGRYYFEAGGDYWRIGCKTGDYGVGNRIVRIQGKD